MSVVGKYNFLKKVTLYTYLIYSSNFWVRDLQESPKDTSFFLTHVLYSFDRDFKWTSLRQRALNQESRNLYSHFNFGKYVIIAMYPKISRTQFPQRN